MGKAILLGIDAAVPTLLESYVEKGFLPNIKKLLAEGSYVRANAVFPGITPVNWATIATGAFPGTHGITDFLIHEAGSPLDESRNAFRSTELRAETLWQAAEREGLRTATLNFPGSWPCTVKRGYCFAGEGSPGTGSVFELRSSSCFASPGVAAGLRDATTVYLEQEGDQKVASINLRPFKDPAGSGPTYRIILQKSQAGPRCKICSENGKQVLTECGLNEWSEWLEGTFIVNGRSLTGTLRFKLTRCSVDLSEFSLYCSQVMPKEGIALPEEVGMEVVNAIGPFLENSGARGYERGWVDLETFLEEGEYKARWLAGAGQYLLEKKGVDLLLLKWHFLDHAQHLFWGKIDPLSPWYVPEEAAGYEKAMIRAYQAADTMVGTFLPYLERGYHLVLVSDHGHIPHLKAMSINNLLWKAGLISWTPGPSGKPDIDWSKTRAYGGPCVGQIWVNLKGRDPEGIVPPEEYTAVQEKIIDLLLSYRDPETGVRPVAMAIKKEEADYFGQWGDRTGDVIYFMREGYSGDFNWSPLSPDGQILVKLGPQVKSEADYGQFKFVASKFQSVHGCGFPNVELGRGTEQAVLVMAGRGIRSGFRLNAPVSLADVAPTLAHFAGLPQPANAEGKIIWQFEDTARQPGIYVG